MQQIKALIFDLGGVIIDYDNSSDYFETEIAHISKDRHITKKQVASYVRTKLFPDFETGKMKAREFYAKMAKVFGIKASQVDWTGNFERRAKINESTIDTVKKASKRGYAIAYLSNVDYGRYRHVKRLLAPYRALFSFGFASCYMHMRKPNKNAFEYVLKKMRISGDQALFIDNEIQNVEGARAAGIKSILFKDNSGLLKELRRLGVL